MNIAQFLINSARELPHRPAVALGARTIHDYASLAMRAARVAGALRAQFGLRPDDRVAIAMRNVPEYIELLYGIWHAGLIAVPINARLHPLEIGYILQDSGARICFATSDLAPRIGGLDHRPASLERIIEVPGPAYDALLPANTIGLAERLADDVAWLFYTSGTTGRPKGVMLTHRNLTTVILCYLADVDTISSQDSILHAAPLSHGSGLYVPPHVAKAACNILPESSHFDPDEVRTLLDIHRGVTMFCAPTMLRRLIEGPRLGDRQLANLKAIVFGGAPMYVADLERALDALGDRLVQIYGQGESPMTITCLGRRHLAARDHPRYRERLASVGLPHTGMEIAIGSESEFLPTGEAGEVLVRGDAVMKGYWRNPEATEETLRGGWLHTGDVGAIDADGFLTLMDRSKDLIISGGSNIYPREIEEVLLRHPGVQEAAVVGGPHPDWGEEIVAFVVRAPGQSVSEAELDQICLQSIARYKRPRRYRFVDELPKNNYGKVLKTDLRQLLREHGGD